MTITAEPQASQQANNVQSIRRRLSRVFGQPLIIIALGLLLLIVIAFVLYPLSQVLTESFRVNGEWSLGNYERVFSRTYFRHTIYNTFVIASLSTLGAVFIGFIFAFGVTRTAMRGKNFFTLVSILPLITPPFFSAFAFILLMGRNGLVNQFLFQNFGFRVNIYGWHGVVIAQSLTMFPIAFLTLTAALSSIDPRLEEAASDMGAKFWYTLRRITLPLLTPAFFSAAILIFMFNISAFGIPAILGSRGLIWPNGSMLGPEAILQILGSSRNLGIGSTLAILMLVPSFGLFLFRDWYVKRRSYITVTGMPTAFSPRPAPKYITFSVTAFCTSISLIILSLYAVIFAGAVTRTWGVDFSLSDRHLQAVRQVSMDGIRNSLMLSMGGAIIASLLGVFIAYVLTRWRFPGRSAFNFMAMLPYALPGLVMGLGLASGYNTGLIVLSGTGLIILINYAVRRMPFGIESSKSALSQIDGTLEHAAADLGAGWPRVFRRITLPLLAPTFFATLTFCFIQAMTDITAVIFLVSPRWRLMSIDIFNAVQAGRLGVAAALASIMIVLIVVVLMVIWRASGLGYRLFKL